MQLGGIIYVRWRKDADRLGRVLPPMSDAHPAAEDPCPVCQRPLANGEPIQLIALGPEPDSRAKCAAWGWINAVGLALHAECLGSDVSVTPPEPESSASQNDP